MCHAVLCCGAHPFAGAHLDSLSHVHARHFLPHAPSSCSSANLAFNYSQWQLFFGMADTPTITTASSSSSPNFSQTLQAARAQALQRKLAGRPQLLSAQVEELVANYYEIAHMLGCEVCLPSWVCFCPLK
jgi:hypothetical protein